MSEHPMSDDAHVAAQRFRETFRKAMDDCTLHIPVNGVLEPLRECDWVLQAPCGCAVSVMSAVSLEGPVADEHAAWHEMYVFDPHPHRRVRERMIKRMKDQGYTIVPMLRTDAVDAYKVRCIHPQPQKRSVEDVGSVDTYPPESSS